MAIDNYEASFFAILYFRPKAHENLRRCPRSVQVRGPSE